MENSNEVFLRVTNHTGQAEKNLLGPAGIRTRDLRFTSPMLYQPELQVKLGAGRQMMVLGLFDISKQNLVSSNLDYSLHTLRFNYYGTVNSGGE